MPFVDHRVKEANCPGCGERLGAATNLVSEGAPETGDLTICLYCQELLQFLPGGDLRIASPEAWADLALQQPLAYNLLLEAQRFAVEYAQQKGRACD